MDKIRVGDIDVAYRIDGEGEHVVVLAHSLALNADAWNPIVERLGDRFRLLAFDMRGHGDTTATPAPYRLDGLADDVLGLMDALGVGRASYVGVSIGGRIGQVLATRAPDRFHRMVFAATTLGMPAGMDALWADRFERIKARGIAAIMTETIERWYGPTIGAYPIAQLDALAAMIGRCSVEGYEGAARALFDPPVTEGLRQVAIPVLVVSGDSDAGAPPSAGAEIAALVPAAEMVVLAECGHQPALQQPNAFADVLRGFLGKA
jgi:3-oxoadipate enol-lactonase